jgi:hypothetical protein
VDHGIVLVYSSGGCSGFSPLSLLNKVPETKYSFILYYSHFSSANQDS